ncbi:MAG: acetate/propionate family kinase [Buchnera aphidicola (Schlechtendalia chinensis)]
MVRRFSSFKKKNVAVFDTAFHSTIPKTSFIYAIPYTFYNNYGIRKYGAHGISYSYVTNKASKMLNIAVKKLNIIVCHLGNGSSVAAVRNGVCVDTSMGLTPLEGLVMGTRCGDLDPAIVFFMYNKLKMSMKDIENILMKKSGLIGINEISSNFRNLEKNYHSNAKIKLSIDIFCYRLSKYISSYMPIMGNKLNGIVFTGGIGENSCLVRTITVSRLSFLNFEISERLNLSIKFLKKGFINVKNSKSILVIPTNEELMIAKETALLVQNI